MRGVDDLDLDPKDIMFFIYHSGRRLVESRSNLLFERKASKQIFNHKETPLNDIITHIDLHLDQEILDHDREHPPKTDNKIE